ncbi:MFS transporter [Jatrophihabitans sp.]|uniref:MFS transporter n=1 Tax=Jatrophihabitans sp. TaxID=1932789 RepID=UPI002CCC425C|nr:MFS transporter [Jatrophihabitans sp.]
MSFISAGSLWRVRDLRIVVLARAVSLLGDELAVVALLLRTQGQGSGAWPVAALLLAGGLPLVLFAPLVGRLVDRVDSRRLLLASGCGQLACCLWLAWLPGQPVMLALVAVLGTGQAINSASWQALVPGIVGVDRLPAALGISQAVTTAAGIAAPALGGLLTGLYGARVPLLLDAASFTAVALAALTIRTRRGGAALRAADPRGGWAVLRADAMLLPLVGMLSVFILLGSMVNVVEVFLVRETLHASATWYGVLGSGWGVGLLVGALLGGRFRDGSGATGQLRLLRLALVSAGGLALGLAGMGAAPTVAWVLPAVLAGGVCNGLVNLAIGSLVGMRSAEAVRGRVAAVVGGLASAGQVGALLLGGLLAGILEPRQIFLLAGLAGLLVPVCLAHQLLASAASATAPAPEAALPAAALPAAALPATALSASVPAAPFAAEVPVAAGSRR